MAVTIGAVNRLVWWALVAAAVGAVTVSVLAAGGEFALSGPDVTAQVLAVLAGTALTVCGGLRSAHGQGAVGLAGVGWLVAEWANPEAPDALVFTLGLAVGAVGFAPFLLLGLVAVPAAGRLRLLRTVAIGTAAAAAVVQGPLVVAMSDPATTGCTGCPGNLLALRTTGDATRLADAATVVVALSCAAAVVVVLLQRPGGAPYVQAVSVAAVGATGVTAWVMVAQGPGSGAAYDTRALTSLALLALAGSRFWLEARRRLALRAVTRAVVRTSRSGADSSAEAVLRTALSDPGLTVRYPVDGHWVDLTGTAVAPPAGRTVVLADGGDVLAALTPGGDRDVDGSGLDEVLVGVRLLLDVDRLQARQRALARELGEARRRAVDSADEARTTLERDLHDGAQQRLVALRYALGLARFRAGRDKLPEVVGLLDESDAAVEQALTELRTIAHGMSGPALASVGLVEAVRSAAARCGAAATVDRAVAEVLAPHVTRTSYAVVLEGLTAAVRSGAGGVRVSLAREAPRRVATVSVTAGGPRPSGLPSAPLAERVALVDGRIDLTSQTATTWQLRAELPCG